MTLLCSEGMVVLFLCVALLFCKTQGDEIFDVTTFGAKADPAFDSNTAFTRAWTAACKSPPPARVVIPPGDYMASEVFFSGPCKGPVTVEVRGTIFADTDISNYPNGFWFGVEHVDGFKIDGANFQGSFNGTGESAWKYATCDTPDCKLVPMPANFLFNDVQNGDVGYLSSLDSKGYHFNIIYSMKVNLHDLKIHAPSTSPHTNAANMVSSNGIKVSNSQINTGGGKDCVIWDPASKNIFNSQVSCNVAKV